MSERWVPLSIPGRDEDDDAATTWFAYNMASRQSIPCRSAEAAAAECRRRNGRARPDAGLPDDRDESR